MAEPSVLLTGLFVTLLLVTLGICVAATARWTKIQPGPATLVIACWMAFTGALAQFGALQNWESFPPPAVLLFTFGFLMTLALSRMRWAKKLAGEAPIALLVGFQAFRIPLELIMYRAATEGVMPIQMSFSGQNFDIITGILAALIGLWGVVSDAPRAILWAFTGIGLGLLINIVTIAIRSTPVIAAYGPEQLNLWVTIAPFVWLPTVFVTLALFGHLLLIQRLQHPPKS